MLLWISSLSPLPLSEIWCMFQILRFYSSVWHSFLRVTEVLLFCSISFPSHVWNPGFRLISCFHWYRASPHINTSDPGVRSTGIFGSTRRASSASTKLKCITHGDSKETIAMPSSKRIRSTCAPIPCTPQQCVLWERERKSKKLHKFIDQGLFFCKKRQLGRLNKMRKEQIDELMLMAIRKL